MNDIQTQARTPRKQSLLKACIGIGIIGSSLCFLWFCGSLAWGAYSTARLSGPACPDGISPPAEAKIAFASSRNSSNTNSDIYIINADGSGQTQLTHSSDSMDVGKPVWSKDGAKLFFRSYENDAYFVMNADGSGLTEVPNNTVPGIYSGLSPDGKQIAFAENNDIYVMNADGSGRKKLTSHASLRVNTAPAWSPDGSRIAFLLHYPAGLEQISTHLLSIRPDGTGLTDINDSAISYAWSPDGSRIAVVGDDRYLYVMQADGSGLMRITRMGMDLYNVEGAVTWSPDGEWLAFQASDNSSINSSIAITKSTCSGGIRWLSNTSSSHSPAWQPTQK